MDPTIRDKAEWRRVNSALKTLPASHSYSTIITGEVGGAPVYFSYSFRNKRKQQQTGLQLLLVSASKSMSIWRDKGCPLPRAGMRSMAARPSPASQIPYIPFQLVANLARLWGTLDKGFLHIVSHRTSLPVLPNAVLAVLPSPPPPTTKDPPAGTHSIPRGAANFSG